MDIETFAERLDAHLADVVEPGELAESGRRFVEVGFAKTSFLVPADVKRAVAEEVLHLVDDAGVRRNVRFRETGNTPRRMRNVARAEIAGGSSLIPYLYRSKSLLRALSVVVGEPVLECPYEPEQYVITRLEEAGDTHGWHWDDYSFALVWVVECPAVEDGGFVQCVSNTVWNKQNPQVNRALVSGVIHSMELAPGDLYVMRTDTTLHRVYPITKGRRTIINMGYASAADLRKSISHETMDGLWERTSELSPTTR